MIRGYLVGKSFYNKGGYEYKIKEYYVPNDSLYCEYFFEGKSRGANNYRFEDCLNTIRTNYQANFKLYDEIKLLYPEYLI